MPPADSASRAGVMPKASGDRSSRTLARNMRPLVFQRYPLTSTAVFTLALLLLLPVQAAFRLADILPYYLVPGVMVIFSFWVYRTLAYDKKRAQTDQWRVPESTLHFLELLGGWPGSFVAQRRFRHKISKLSYQFTFWIIVIGYQVVVFDYLNDWKYSEPIVACISKLKNG